jgi:hypothetical protein
MSRLLGIIVRCILVLQLSALGERPAAAQLDDDPEEEAPRIQYEQLWLAVLRLADDFENGLKNVQRSPCSRRGALLFCPSNVDIPSALRTQITIRDTGELAVTSTFTANKDLASALKTFSAYAAALHALGSSYPAQRRGGPSLQHYKGLPILVVWLPRNTVARLYLSKLRDAETFSVDLRIQGVD